MRWSLFFLIAAFFFLSAYVGWEQGAFDFKKEKMALTETITTERKYDCQKATAEERKVARLHAELKEPLKSQLAALIKERNWDEAAALYEEKNGVTEQTLAYGVLLNLAREKE